MSSEAHDFRPRLRISRAALLIIAGSVLLHAAVILASYLAPKPPPEPSRYLSGCVEPAPDVGRQPLSGSPPGGRSAGGAGSGAAGPHRVGSSFARGPEVALPGDAEIIWPCCGPGCPTEVVVP